MKFCTAHHTIYLISTIMFCNNACDIIIAQLISVNAQICIHRWKQTWKKQNVGLKPPSRNKREDGRASRRGGDGDMHYLTPSLPLAPSLSLFPFPPPSFLSPFSLSPSLPSLPPIPLSPLLSLPLLFSQEILYSQSSIPY